MKKSEMEPVRVGVVGASGYAGSELVRILIRHPAADIRWLGASSNAGVTIEELFPEFEGVEQARNLPVLASTDAFDWADLDFAFFCLPHGVSQDTIASVMVKHPNVRIIDLGADFRLQDAGVFARWYGFSHRFAHFIPEALYGLPEICGRDDFSERRLIAVPGCHASCTILGLWPLITARCIEPRRIVIHSATGISGAGRKAQLSMMFCEISEGMRSYGATGHRHSAEISQALAGEAGSDIDFTFVPLLVPMNRGIHATIVVTPKPDIGEEDVHRCLSAFYEDSSFIRVRPVGYQPDTRHVRGTNRAEIGIFQDRTSDRVVIQVVLDNLMKGAAGQAVQCFNLACGFPDTLGLEGISRTP